MVTHKRAIAHVITIAGFASTMPGQVDVNDVKEVNMLRHFSYIIFS